MFEPMPAVLANWDAAGTPLAKFDGSDWLLRGVVGGYRKLTLS